MYIQIVIWQLGSETTQDNGCIYTLLHNYKKSAKASVSLSLIVVIYTKFKRFNMPPKEEALATQNEVLDFSLQTIKCW